MIEYDHTARHVAAFHFCERLVDLLEADPDAVAMHRLEGEGLENQHVERALHQIA